MTQAESKTACPSEAKHGAGRCYDPWHHCADEPCAIHKPAEAPAMESAYCVTCDQPLPLDQNSATPQHLTAARHLAFGHNVRPVQKGRS